MKTKHYRLYSLISIAITILFLHACSPPAFDIDIIERIDVIDGVVYARASQDCNYCGDEHEYIYFLSVDNGQTWKDIELPTSDIFQQLNVDENTKSPVCSSLDSKICYRITDEEWVEVSSDGGITWQIDWQIPNGRKYYMQRHANYYPAPDTTPFDMQLIESNDGHYVIVAMGNQGVLVKSLDGKWSRYPVGKATPTPYQASSFAEANEILFLHEQIAIVLIAVCFFLIFSVCIWLLIYLNSDTLLRRKFLRAYSPSGITLGIFLLYWLVIFTGSQYIIDLFLEFQVLIVILPWLGFIISWLAVIIVSIKRRFILFALLMGIGFSLLSYFGMIFPFQLWALGLISVYENARIFVWILGISILLIGIVVARRIAPLAVKQPNGDL